MDNLSDKKSRLWLGLDHMLLTPMDFEFEHGGKDLALLRNATNMFNVAINLPNVQEPIWAHAASALDYLQNEEIIKHCNVTPHNILLSSNHHVARLYDFGHARNMSDVVTGGGTHCYIAPEFLLEGKISAASDIWALRITMLYVVHVYVAAVDSMHVALFSPQQRLVGSGLAMKQVLCVKTRLLFIKRS
jgi:serine/threonine protein kinase